MPGVEHLLRDVKDASVSTLAAEVGTLAAGLRGLRTRLLQIQRYLELVLAGQLPVNHDIMYQLQARASRRHCVEATQLLAGDTRAACAAHDACKHAHAGCVQPPAKPGRSSPVQVIHSAVQRHDAGDLPRLADSLSPGAA